MSVVWFHALAQYFKWYKLSLPHDFCGISCVYNGTCTWNSSHNLGDPLILCSVCSDAQLGKAPDILFYTRHCHVTAIKWKTVKSCGYINELQLQICKCENPKAEIFLPQTFLPLRLWLEMGLYRMILEHWCIISKVLQYCNASLCKSVRGLNILYGHYVTGSDKMISSSINLKLLPYCTGFLFKKNIILKLHPLQKHSVYWYTMKHG